MRRFRRPTALLAGLALLITQACSSFQVAGGSPPEPSDRVRVEYAGEPLVLRWRPAPGAPAVADCRAESVEGVMASIRGDTLDLSSVTSVAQYGDGPTSCAHRFPAQLVLAPGDFARVKVLRADSGPTYAAVLVVVAIVVLAYSTIKIEFRPRPISAP